MSVIIPQSLDEQDAIRALGHAIGVQMHRSAMTCSDEHFTITAAAIAVAMGVPADVATFVAIDAHIWSQAMLDDLEAAVKEIS